ncbi:hypothetical protein DSM106972_040070 [Dulcicalothrix desertica PCC 7102]|uniref:Uncharacterized protein n=1 Tax=Dulcicalothrix desertica PCC 7102 TaxID=232991 RepID=A0A3S1ANJ5_9CYAN|nr:hypothetical protein [Dulcicalothrix desertica]RUT05186.1 hypothetical protein DSM106972_040070 [Dulcicalothrix desertica PCC 7102]TWH43309.1 hypothetical protein CAL7102_07020 [Dulcicalothrix desertica PCC 7102]
MTETKPNRTKRRGRIFPEIQWTLEQRAQYEAESEAFYQRCKPIFDKVKAELIETHYNWYMSVEPDSGEYFIDKNLEVASLQCREKHPGKLHYAFRINETGACGRI